MKAILQYYNRDIFQMLFLVFTVVVVVVVVVVVFVVILWFKQGLHRKACHYNPIRSFLPDNLLKYLNFLLPHVSDTLSTS